MGLEAVEGVWGIGNGNAKLVSSSSCCGGGGKGEMAGVKRACASACVRELDALDICGDCFCSCCSRACFCLRRRRRRSAPVLLFLFFLSFFLVFFFVPGWWRYASDCRSRGMGLYHADLLSFPGSVGGNSLVGEPAVTVLEVCAFGEELRLSCAWIRSGTEMVGGPDILQVREMHGET